MTIRRRPDRPFVLVGAGEFGRDCLSVVEALREQGGLPECAGFVDDARVGGSVHGLPVLGPLDWLVERASDWTAVVTIGTLPARRIVAERLVAAGVRFVNLVHPNVVIGPGSRIGDGVVLMAGVSITVDSAVGDHVGINPGCTIAHDVTLGDWGYVSPGVHIAGRVTIGAEAYLGIGASILPGRVVGAGATVGAGAVVVHDVAPGATVIGVPARPLVRDHRTPGEPPSDPSVPSESR